MRKQLLDTRARTLNLPVRSLTTQRVILPLQQRWGAPCKPTVEVGRRVRIGDLVAASEPGSDVELRVHASVAGVVVALNGAVVIDGDGSQEETRIPCPDQLMPHSIRAAVKEAGIVGLGGGGFPTYAKLSLTPGLAIDSVILNGCESEPHLTCDYRALIEQPEEVVDGLGLIRSAVDAEHGYIVAGSDRRDAIRRIASFIGADNGNRAMAVEHDGVLGYEYTLIHAVLDRQVPYGKLPRDVGVIVQNVQTAIAVSQAVRLGKPLTSRVITVAGDAITRPGNYRVPVGTPVETILDRCGWQPHCTGAVIMGGPMMGLAVDDLQTPIRKGTSGVLALTHDQVRRREQAPCIRCGSCVDACPIGLVPVDIARLSAASASQLQPLCADYCIECGECEYACPSGLPLIGRIRQAKNTVSRAT